MAADDSAQGQQATTRRRRGRPPGSKTKTTRRRLAGSELIEQLNNLVAQMIKENRKLKRAFLLLFGKWAPMLVASSTLYP